MDREHALMIVKCYKEAILPLLANAKVYLYGSCSRNEARKDSDIDVAVVIPKLNGDWLDTTSSLWLGRFKAAPICCVPRSTGTIDMQHRRSTIMCAESLAV